jgi:uroporphyrinogen-III synthase
MGQDEAVTGGGLSDLRVLFFESRRAVETAELVRRHGGEPRSAPAMREVPLADSPAALNFARRLCAGEIDVAVFLTGVGTRYLAEAIAGETPREELGKALATIVTVARGPKPVAALREIGVAPTVIVPEPNTWRELVAAIDARLDVRGKNVAIQEYGEKNPELVAALVDRGSTVLRVPVYRWALPEDLAPLERAIGEIVAGRVDVVLVTSATQIEHLFRVAGTERAEALSTALSRTVVGSIGPIASEALRRHGVEPDFAPEHPKLGQLVLAAAVKARETLVAKRT